MSPTVLPAAKREEGGLRGTHVLVTFLAFFATVFLVNGSLIYNAIKTNSGLVANEPYRKGLHYNERIAADERQAQLHWSETTTLTREGRVSISLSAENERPVTALKVQAMIGRPSTNALDKTVTLEETAPGRYEARVGPLDAGNWLVAFEARVDARAEDPVYRARKRLWLKP